MKDILQGFYLYKVLQKLHARLLSAFSIRWIIRGKAKLSAVVYSWNSLMNEIKWLCWRGKRLSLLISLSFNFELKSLQTQSSRAFPAPRFRNPTESSSSPSPPSYLSTLWYFHKYLNLTITTAAHPTQLNARVVCGSRWNNIFNFYFLALGEKERKEKAENILIADFSKIHK